MPRKKKDKYVSDFVTDDEVALSGITAIWSGVGSGKNSFIEGIHEEIIQEDGTTKRVDVKGLAENYRVLLITSRKAKVVETRKRHAEDLSSYLTDIRHIDDIDFDVYDNKSLVCTTAHIKQRIEKDYSPSEFAPEPFWKKFDYIVIDEFHSLIADATFSDTAFVMKCFIDKIYADCIQNKPATEIKPKLIFMSGTPHSTKVLLSNYVYLEYDLFGKAKYIKPKNINFTYYKEAISSIGCLLKKGRTVVYYMWQLDKLKELINVAKEAGIDETQIAVSVSDADTIKMIKSNYGTTIYPNIRLVEENLSSHMTIPSNIKFFITNSKNKEGININTVPDLLVIEHHLTDDIVQICGRFRKSIKNVKVIYDSQPFHLPISYEKEEEYQREQGILAANNYLAKLIPENDVDISFIPAHHNKAVSKFIDYIEKSTPFVRFNPFTNRFEMNECYIQARNDYYTGLSSFNSMMNDFARGSIVSLSGYFWDNIRVTYTESTEPFYALMNYLDYHQYKIGVTVFTESQGDKMLNDLIALRNSLSQTKPKEYKSLGAILKFFGFQKKQYGKAENKKFKIIVAESREEN